MTEDARGTGGSLVFGENLWETLSQPGGIIGGPAVPAADTVDHARVRAVAVHVVETHVPALRACVRDLATSAVTAEAFAA